MVELKYDGTRIARTPTDRAAFAAEAEIHRLSRNFPEVRYWGKDWGKEAK
jgi:hypothetical protein